MGKRNSNRKGKRPHELSQKRAVAALRDTELDTPFISGELSLPRQLDTITTEVAERENFPIGLEPVTLVNFHVAENGNGKKPQEPDIELGMAEDSILLYKLFIATAEDKLTPELNREIIERPTIQAHHVFTAIREGNNLRRNGGCPARCPERF